jgi:hypothetical protein
MNMPGFTADASNYQSHVSYRAFLPQVATSTLAIEPQAPPPTTKGCYTCRSTCFIKFRRNPVRLADCLDSCPCLF